MFGDPKEQAFSTIGPKQTPIGMCVTKGRRQKLLRYKIGEKVSKDDAIRTKTHEADNQQKEVFKLKGEKEAVVAIGLY